ncbi:MAG: exodeoxyribonuclease V subunit gamma [Ignavibacteriales bacterium]|nr:exodeoxyribonuclease V subunit gamma [Ignavibacteriales bacterium]
MILTKENIASVDVDSFINQKIESNKIDELLLIVPTNRKARNLKKEIISKIPLRAASGLNIETLGTLSTKILQQIKPFKQLSEAAATVFIKQSAQEIEMRYLSLYKDEIPFGTLDRIKNVISEYKKHGITPDLLRNEAANLKSSEKLKALDIADIYEIFIKKCFALNAYELGDIYSQLNSFTLKEFVAIFHKLFEDVNLIILDGFSEFSNPEIEILSKLSSVGNTKLFLRFDYATNNKSIFSHLDKCYDRLIDLGFIKIEDVEKTTGFRNTLQENLFKNKRPSAKIDETGRITKIAAHNRDNEVELIAKEIKKLIIEHNVEPHNICVAFNLIQEYSSIVKDAFSKYGIPVNLTDRTPLDNSNPITAVVNYLEIVENDFYFKNIFRALSSRFIEIAEVDNSNLYRISSELKIVAGKENWINILNDCISNLKHTGDEFDEVTTKRTSYTKALNDIRSISELLKPFEEKLTISEFQERLNDFIVESKLPLKLLGTEIDEEKNIRAFTDFIETTSEVFGLLKKEYTDGKKFTIDFFMNQIRTACNWARFNVKEKSNYGVQVTTLEEIRGLKFDYLFLGGLCDGDFPTRYQPEIFNSGSFKKQSQTHQIEEHYRFYQSLCGWNKKLFFSYSATDGKRETIVSTFLKEFEELFSISSKDEAGNENTLFSEEELQIFIGKNGIEAAKNILKNGNGAELERISKSLEIENIRNKDPFASSNYTGDLLTGESEPELFAELTERLKAFSSKQYSISQLETYAKCPFKFFVERVLGIKTVDEPTEDIEAIEMGRILHSIFYEFYSTLRDKGIILPGCSDKDYQSAQKLIFQIAEKQLQTTAFKSPLTFYEREKILGINGNELESVLNRFLETERKGDSEFLPKYFEVSFGRLRSDEADQILSDTDPIQIDGIKLRGKIDRIEVNEKISSFNIVDYKLSGTKPSFSDLKNGISLQLPVYLFAASELLAKKMNKEYSPNEIFIYSLKYAIDEFGKKVVKSKGGKDDEIQSVEQLVQKSISHVKNYIELISKGKFNLSQIEDRENKVCRFCEFRTVCRIDNVINN